MKILSTCRDVLSQGFGFMSVQNGNGEPCKKLAVMIIDGSIRFGADPIQVSNAFIARDITLAVVATHTPAFEIWDFYRDLADYTGGEYMLMDNASCVLPRVITPVANDASTLRQAFRHGYTKDNPTDIDQNDHMNEEFQFPLEL
ncbi:hypothetical protein I4U23_002115 [Adineta vaga]|nr:hypothetical protein I4U23_002115 [Adineta vaga]